MKQIFLYCFLLMVVLTSCQKEFEPIINFQPPWPEGTSDYAPYTVGSTFTYESVDLAAQTTDEFTYTVAKDTIINDILINNVLTNNLKFYKLVSNKPNLGPSPTYYVNYHNGYLTEYTLNLNFLGALTIPVLSENTFRFNEPVNATWNEILPPLTFSGIPVLVDFNYTVVQKDYTKSVLTNNFANTTYVKEVTNIRLGGGIPLPAGIPDTIQYDNYYAKGIGLVERDIYTLGTTQKLKSFGIVR
jgi:hypothetical protein